jgi:hypothetical protein
MTTTKKGSTLVAVLITVTVVSTLLGVITNVTRFQTRNTNRTILRSQAIAHGDAVLESLFDQWRFAMLNVNTTIDRSDGLSNSTLAGILAAPTTAQLPAPQGISVAGWSVTAANPMLGPTSRGDGRPEAEQGTNSRLRTRLYYVARVQINYTGFGATDNVSLERTFVRAGKNLFDNFFFGTQQEIEFHPGAPMYVDGQVYVGGNVYTAHDYLHFMSDVTYLGTHTIDYRPTDPRIGTNPTIDDDGLANNWNPDNPPRRGAEQKLFDTRTDQLDPRFLDDPISNDTDSDSNQNNNGYHELIEEPSTGTDPLQLDPATSERLSQNADYRVYVNAANAITIFKGSSATALSTSSVEYTNLAGALTVNTALRDVREADNVRVVTMDVSLIKTASDTNKITDNVGGGDGLLIYVADTSTGTSVPTVVKNSATGGTTAVTSATKRGVKLVNGAKLPNAGFTMASPNTVYIQGDYNTGKTSTTQPASNTATSYTPPADRPSPVVTGYNRVASAVAGDAVNILSNAWNDANSLLAQSSRVAVNTTVNTAVLAGNVPTTTSSYSGGVENFVRFHENWSGKYFTIYGTLALLYNSQLAKGTWSAADYTPPNRRWYYDVNFQEHNPPGFRVARSYERGRWTVR